MTATHHHHHGHAEHGAAGSDTNRMALSATLHCLTGCAIGEIAGLMIGTALGLATVPTIALAVGLAFGLPKLALGVLLLQVATPVAVTSYMLAAKYRARPDEVAGLVVVSTLISIPAIPIILAFFV